jgi:TRAP-type C4-dicarboxylate transport system permease small subunit
VADVSLRSGLNLVIFGVLDIVSVLLILVIFGGMAYTKLHDGHVRISVIVDRFSPNTRLIVTTCADLLATGIVAIISWRSVNQALFLINDEITTPLLDIPLFPFALATAFFMALFAIAFLADFLKNLSSLIGNDARVYLWLVPGTCLVAFLFGLLLQPSFFFPIEVGSTTFGIIALLLLFILIFLHVHIGAAMAVVTVGGIAYLVVHVNGSASCRCRTK